MNSLPPVKQQIHRYQPPSVMLLLKFSEIQFNSAFVLFIFPCHRIKTHMDRKWCNMIGLFEMRASEGIGKYLFLTSCWLSRVFIGRNSELSIPL